MRRRLFAYEHTQAFIRCHSLLRHLYIRVLASVLVHTLERSMDVDTGLCVSTLMLTCFTFINICRGKTTHGVKSREELLSKSRVDARTRESLI